MSETEDTEYSPKSLAKDNQSKVLYPPTHMHKLLKEDKIRINTIKIISDLLNNICEENENKTKNIASIYVKPFMTKNIPSVSIENYMMRLFQFTKINESTIILILIYIDRFCNLNNISLSYYNVHKLILAATVSAVKYNEDQFYSLNVYAKLGGIPINELNLLEYKFLSMINFSVFVEEELFSKYNDFLLDFQDEEEEEKEEEEED